MNSINLIFKNISEPKAITIKTDRNIMNIIICDVSIMHYYSPELLELYSLAPFEYFDSDCKKEFNISLDYTHFKDIHKKREHCSKVKIINISSEKLSVRYINDKFIIGKSMYPFNMEDIICRSSTDSESELNKINNNEPLLSYQYISYDIRDSIIKCDRDKDFINELNNIFDSFNEFIVLMNLIKEKYKDSEIEICNYNIIELNKFNYIELHCVDRNEFTYSQYIEVRLGYKDINELNKNL